MVVTGFLLAPQDLGSALRYFLSGTAALVSSVSNSLGQCEFQSSFDLFFCGFSRMVFLGDRFTLRLSLRSIGGRDAFEVLVASRC